MILGPSTLREIERPGESGEGAGDLRDCGEEDPTYMATGGLGGTSTSTTSSEDSGVSSNTITSGEWIDGGTAGSADVILVSDAGTDAGAFTRPLDSARGEERRSTRGDVSWVGEKASTLIGSKWEGGSRGVRLSERGDERGAWLLGRILLSTRGVVYSPEILARWPERRSASFLDCLDRLSPPQVLRSVVVAKALPV